MSVLWFQCSPTLTLQEYSIANLDKHVVLHCGFWFAAWSSETRASQLFSTGDSIWVNWVSPCDPGLLKPTYTRVMRRPTKSRAVAHFGLWSLLWRTSHLNHLVIHADMFQFIFWPLPQQPLQTALTTLDLTEDRAFQSAGIHDRSQRKHLKHIVALNPTLSVQCSQRWRWGHL